MKSIPHKVGRNTTYYMTRKTERSKNNPDYANLPLRDHKGTARIAREIEHAEDEADAKSLVDQYGINGRVRHFEIITSPVATHSDRALPRLQACFFDIDSIQCPWSFPLDLMHVLYENIMPQLMALWQGTYKVSQTLQDAKAKHKAPFALSPNTWRSIRKEVKLSNHTTPSQIAPHVGDILTKTHWTADTQSYFLMFLGPIVMRNRLPPEYYKHFILLSEIAKRLTMQEIAYAQFATLRKDILSWVKGFER